MCLRDFCSLVYSFLHLLIQQIFFKVFIVSRIVEGMLSDSNVLRMKEKWKMYFAEIAKTDTHLSMHIHKHGPQLYRNNLLNIFRICLFFLFLLLFLYFRLSTSLILYTSISCLDLPSILTSHCFFLYTALLRISPPLKHRLDYVSPITHRIMSKLLSTCRQS